MVGIVPARTRMLLRDLRAAAGQYLAIALVIVLGVAFHGAAGQSYRNLDNSYRLSYARLRFEDFGIAAPGMPRRMAARVASLPGVAAAQGRVTAEVEVELPGRAAGKLVGRLISIPAGRRPAVDDLLLLEGAWPSRDTAREVVLEASFARHHGLHPGGTVAVVRGRERTRLRIAAVARSPEYIYVVRSRQDILPFPDTFGVMFVPEGALSRLLGRVGRIDEIRVRMRDPALREAAMAQTRRLLAGHRPEAPVRREDQPSHQLLRQDVEGFRSYAVMFPALFLMVAGLTLNTLLTRQVLAGRARIGLLRALGLSRAEVVRHVIGSALVVGGASSVVGALLGAWLSDRFTRFYVAQLSVPFVAIVVEPATVATGVGLGMGLALLSAGWPARRASSVAPSEALRPASPGRVRAWRPDAWIPGLPLLWRLPARNLVRQPRRSLSTLLGVVASMVLIVVARGLQDTTDAMMGSLLGAVFREDLRADFAGWQDRSVVERVRGWPGVTWAEGELGVAVELSRGGRVYEALAVGLPEGARLRGLSDASGRRIAPDGSGAIFGPTLRRRLDLEVGDLVAMRVPPSAARERPSVAWVRVSGFSAEAIGTMATFRSDDLRRALRADLGAPSGAIGALRVSVAPGQAAQVRHRLLGLDRVASVSASADLLGKIREAMGLLRRIVTVMLFFGMALAFAVVFNTVTINVLEREAEAATLRTLGVGRGALAGSVVAENLLLALAGVLAGAPLGKAATRFFILAAQTEEQMDLFAMVPVVAPQTLWLASGLVLASVLVSVVPALWRLSRLDLAAAVKKVAR